MKTPLQKLKEILYAYDLNEGKAGLRIAINRLMEEERQSIVDAANHGHNRYVNEQLNGTYGGSDRNFGQAYYDSLYRMD